MTPTPSPSEEPTAEATATATAEPTATAEATETPAAEPTATAGATETATAGVTETPTSEPTAVSTETPTADAAETPTATPTATAEEVETPTETPLPTATGTPVPAQMTAEVDGAMVWLRWSGIGATDVHARVVRRLNEPPAGPDDPAGTVVFDGEGAEAADAMSDLLPDTTAGPGAPAVRREYFYTVYPCSPEGECAADGVTAQIRPTLLQALRAGGYVIHWRHASADVCSDQLGLGTAATTSVPNWWRSCESTCAIATARQLNAAGVAESIELGNVFRERDIPVGRVISSEFCRNFSTAELMDLGPAIELRPDVTYYVHAEAMRCASSYALIGEVPAGGSNTAIIGHAGFSGTCAVLNSLAWSEAAVFKPDGTGAATLVARLLWEQWRLLP